MARETNDTEAVCPNCGCTSETNDSEALCPSCGCASWRVRKELTFKAECERCGNIVALDKLEEITKTPQFSSGEKATAEWADATVEFKDS